MNKPICRTVAAAALLSLVTSVAGQNANPPRARLAKAVVPIAAGGTPLVQRYAEQNNRSNADWGSTLTDIVRHLPSKSRYDDAFRRYIEAGDLITAGHEWTHFLNESLTLKSSAGVTAFYVLENRYIELSHPEGLRGIVPPVPASLRGSLYQLYLVQNASNARVDPLYLFDEWVAYINDVTVAVNQLEERKPLNALVKAVQPETAGNVLEFMFYGCALGMAVKQHDPAYYHSEPGRALREFIAWNARRSLEIHAQGVRHPELSRGDARNAGLMRQFRNSDDTAAMREWVRSDLPQIARLLGMNDSLAAANGG